MSSTALTRSYSALLLLLLLVMSSVSATVVNDLYSAKVPVKTQSLSERSAALTTAFKAVMVKVTGQSQYGDAKQTQALLDNAEKYVQQYSFLTNTNPLQADKPYLLKVDFVANAINGVLLQHNLPVWGQDRPLTLFWVSDKRSGKAQLVGANSSNVLATLLDKDTDERGIPAILPLLDLTDLSHVSVSDVDAPFMQTLQTAASRYGSNAMVVLRVKQTGQKIETVWTLDINNNLQNWRFSGDDIQKIIQQGVNQVADMLAQQFAVQSQTQQAAVDVTVMGLNSLSDFAKARAYLQNLAPVKTAAIEQINGDGVIYKLELLGSVASLERVIKLDHTLQAVTLSDQANPESNTLSYQWNS